MGKKFLASFTKLFASLSAALLLSVPSTTEAVSAQPNLAKLPTFLQQKATLEISGFVLEKSADIDSSEMKWHSSHRSHASHSSHRSHYSSRY
jgi:hypothetical protein